MGISSILARLQRIVRINSYILTHAQQVNGATPGMNFAHSIGMRHVIGQFRRLWEIGNCAEYSINYPKMFPLTPKQNMLFTLPVIIITKSKVTVALTHSCPILWTSLELNQYSQEQNSVLLCKKYFSKKQSRTNCSSEMLFHLLHLSQCVTQCNSLQWSKTWQYNMKQIMVLQFTSILTFGTKAFIHVYDRKIYLWSE